MNANQNRQLLVRQLRAICKAVNRGEGGACVILDVEGGGFSKENTPALLRVTINGVVVCKFCRYGKANYDFINECRERVCAAMTARGMTAGLEAMRVTA